MNLPARAASPFVNNRGAALLTAIMVLAIVSAISTSLMLREQIDIHRSQLNFDATQVYHYSDMVNAWAEAYYGKRYSNREKQAPPPVWPAIMPPQILSNGAKIHGRLESAQGRFNLNNLTDQRYWPLFARLLRYVDSNLNERRSEQLTQEIANWIGTKKTSQQQATLTPNNPLAQRGKLLLSPSEILLVPSVNYALYEKLAPYIVALPETTSIDPNTASKAILIAYGISDNNADQVINKQNNDNGFETMAEFERIANFRPSTNNTQHRLSLFALKSDYFIVEANIDYAKIVMINYAILRGNEKTAKLQLLQQTQNTL